MKKLLGVLSIMLITGMLFGCGDTTNATSTATATTNQNYDKTGTLQGKIMDATTGVGLGNDTNSNLNVWLIQGTDNRWPNKLINNNTDPLVGEYAFSGIPVDINTVEITFKVVVVKAGYQRFEANVSMMEAAFDGTTLNNVINKIGNIYLFPLITSAGDVSVYVYNSQDRPVLNAMVHLQQEVVNNNTTVYTADRLAATGGLYSSLTGTTNAAGLATFGSAKLTLGGRYRVVVEPKTFDGEQLARYTAPGTFDVGIDSTTQVAYMAVTNSQLFATSASNQTPGTITSTGVLTITFNQPIVLSTTTFTGALTSTITGTVGSVTGALDAAGTTLTITPTFTTTPTGANATIIYSYGGTIFLKNSQAPTAYTLFGGAIPVQNITTNAAVSGAVQMIVR